MEERDDQDIPDDEESTLPVARGSGKRSIGASFGSARYEMLSVLGVGGMGKVDLFRDSWIGREVAIKSIRPDSAIDASVLVRFEREARVQARLEHPAIVPVYEIGQSTAGEMFFVMKRVNGVSLSQVIGELREGDIQSYLSTRPRLLRAFSSACLAIAFAHSRGVIHRDLKPSNVMLGEFGEVNVLDWGIAKVAGDHSDSVSSASSPVEDVTVAGLIMGSPGYMAPEQADDASAVDARADVYALGCVLFELLALEPLHRGDSPLSKLRSTLGGDISETDRTPSARALDRSIPPELDAVCVKATAENLNDRYDSARDLAEAIERYLDGERDIERRRELSRGHVEAAQRAALEATQNDDADAAHEARVRALREANLALALDPSNRNALGAIGDVLLTPIEKLPAQGEAALTEETHRKFQNGTRDAALAFGLWFLWVPLMVNMGVRNWTLALATCSLIGLCAASAYWLSRRSILTWRSGAFTLFCGVSLLAAVYPIFGSFVMMPCVLVTLTFVWFINTGAYPRWQTFTFVGGVVFLVLLCALETTGLLPPSTTIAGNAIVITPRVINFPPVLTSIALWTVELAMFVVPATIAIRVTRALASAERRLFAQAWLARKLSE